MLAMTLTGLSFLRVRRYYLEAHGISVPSAVSGHSVAQVDQEAVALAAAAVADAVDESAQEGPFAAPRYQMPTEASLLREAASGRGGRSVADLDIDDMR